MNLYFLDFQRSAAQDFVNPATGPVQTIIVAGALVHEGGLGLQMRPIVLGYVLAGPVCSIDVLEKRRA